MTVKNPPVYIESGTYSSEYDRLVTSLLLDRTLATNKTTISAFEGGVVPPYNQLQVTSPSSNMTLTISSGTALVPRVSLDPPGVYICHNQGVATLTLDVATSTPRIDLIVAKVRDTTQGEAGNAWSLEAVKGTPAATPAPPALPTSAIPLAQVRVVPASQNGGVNRINTSQITDLRVFTSSLGGVHLVWGTHPNPVASPGRLMYDVPNSSLYVSNGINFDPIYSLKETKAWLAQYRPAQAFHIDDCSTGSTDFVSTLRDDATPASTDPMPIIIDGLQSPSGDFIVHLSATGQCSDSGTAGQMSVLVRRSDNNNIVSDDAGHKGPNFYQTNWVGSQVSSLISTGSNNVNLSFTVRARVSAGAGRVSLRRIKLVVQPVL